MTALRRKSEEKRDQRGRDPNGSPGCKVVCKTMPACPNSKLIDRCVDGSKKG